MSGGREVHSPERTDLHADLSSPSSLNHPVSQEHVYDATLSSADGSDVAGEISDSSANQEPSSSSPLNAAVTCSPSSSPVRTASPCSVPTSPISSPVRRSPPSSPVRHGRKRPSYAAYKQNPSEPVSSQLKALEVLCYTFEHMQNFSAILEKCFNFCVIILESGIESPS